MPIEFIGVEPGKSYISFGCDIRKYVAFGSRPIFTDSMQFW
jgi:hypothetical protein